MTYNTERLTDMFEDRHIYLKKLKQVTYESYTEEFANKYGVQIDDMLKSVTESEDSATSAKEVAGDFAKKTFYRYAKKGKIGGSLMMDLNFMMVYYLFPYLIKQRGVLTGDYQSFAEVLKDRWNEVMGCNISYAPYEELYAGFKKKLFGFF